MHGADRVPRDRQARGARAAARAARDGGRGEALNPEVLERGEEATGLEIRDGYGQTETGQLTGMPAPGARAARVDGLPLPGVELRSTTASSCSPTHDRSDVLRLPSRGAPAPGRPWRTGDRVRQDEDGYLYFEGRADDVIISAGYRIGPFEVESALVSHAAVAEAAVVAAPDDERGSIVRAVVVLRDGFEPSAGARGRAPGPRQARDRALQVSADRGVRRRAAEDNERQGPTSAAARARRGRSLTASAGLPAPTASERHVGILHPRADGGACACRGRQRGADRRRRRLPRHLATQCGEVGSPDPEGAPLPHERAERHHGHLRRAHQPPAAGDRARPQDGGTIAFTPASGPSGRRQLIAEIANNGVPIRTQVLASFTAPRPPRPGRAQRLRIRSDGRSFSFSFVAPDKTPPHPRAHRRHRRPSPGADRLGPHPERLGSRDRVPRWGHDHRHRARRRRDPRRERVGRPAAQAGPSPVAPAQGPLDVPPARSVVTMAG